MKWTDWDSKYLEKIKAKVMQKTVAQSSGCSIWQMSCDNQGAPQVGGKYANRAWLKRVHQLTYEWKYGPLELNHVLTKTCETDRCVTPEHFKVIDYAERMKAAFDEQPRPTHESDIERFMSFVTKSSLGCWLWQGSRIGVTGYGVFWLDKKQHFAHRASHILFKGPIPDGLVVMHACDDRACVNPGHLTAGTQKENMEDMARKNRARRGSRNGRTKLTEAEVRALKGEYIQRDGELTRLANKYGTTVSAVSNIIGGNSWRHVKIELGSMPSKDLPHQRMRRGEKVQTAKLTWEKVRELRADFAAGMKLNGIVEKYGIKKAQASVITRGKAWVELAIPHAPVSQVRINLLERVVEGTA